MNIRKLWGSITGQRKRRLDVAKTRMRIRHSYQWEKDLQRVISLSKDPSIVVEAVIELGNIRLARAWQERKLRYGR